jgi:hypothetical protein
MKFNANKNIYHANNLENLANLGTKVYRANICNKLKNIHNYHEFSLLFLQGEYSKKYKAEFTIFY